MTTSEIASEVELLKRRVSALEGLIFMLTSKKRPWWKFWKR